MRRALLAFLFAGAVVGAAPRALACSLAAGPIDHEIDATLKATDTSPPSTPTIQSVVLIQDHDSPPGDSCGDISSLSIELGGSTDDHSPADKIGYEIEVVEGRVPSALTLPTQAQRPGPYNNSSTLIFTFGESNEDVWFKLRVTAIDEAGNRSAPSNVVYENGQHTGCNAAGPTPPSEAAAALLTALVTAGLVRRRRPARA